jgi:hypothetical protein
MGLVGVHEIIFWDVATDGAFKKLLSSTEGNEAATETAIAPLGPEASPSFFTGPSPSAFVSAISKLGNEKLLLMSWDAPKIAKEVTDTTTYPNSANIRLADSGSTVDQGTQIRLAALKGKSVGQEQYVTALKRQDGTLALAAWTLGKEVPKNAKCSTDAQKIKDLAVAYAEKCGQIADVRSQHPPVGLEGLVKQKERIAGQIDQLSSAMRFCPPPYPNTTELPNCN